MNRDLLRELEEEARRTDEVNGQALEIVQQVDRVRVSIRYLPVGVSIWR